MILAFILIFSIFVHIFVLYFMYMLILFKTIDIHVYLRITCFTCHVFYYGLFSCLNMYVYFSFDKIYIYLEACLVLMKIELLIISCFLSKIFWLSFIVLSPCIYWLHDFCTLYILCLLIVLDSWEYMCFLTCWVSINVYLTYYHENIHIFIAYLKDFVLIFKIIFK